MYLLKVPSLVNKEQPKALHFLFQGIEREKEDLEKQMSDLRVQLNFSAMASEVEEVKRCMERKDKEKAHLAAQVEVTLLFLSHIQRTFVLFHRIA